ncbi:MAG: hypothetical protein EPO24_03040 [Bacteroidetes bacterium]|nr:MAG: hypothetical protein EPO24_03040 [Bacteroidota bacterium]
MKRYSTFNIGVALCCFFIMMVGCSSSKLVEIWSDSSFQSPPLKKMVIISVTKNSVQRRIWEDAFSVELAKHGVEATPSYRLFPNAVPDTNQVIQIVQSNGYDGVLVTRSLPSETKTQYLPGYVSTEQHMRYDRRRARFVTYYREIDHYGYIDSLKVGIRVIDVWTTKNDGQMIWSATVKRPNRI